MSGKGPSVAIVGAGIGGLALAATLRQIGIDAEEVFPMRQILE